MLKQQRLLYYRRALEHAPAALFALLQAESDISTSYRAMLTEDVKWMRRNLPQKITDEQLSNDAATAVLQIVNFEPKQWRKLVKQAIANAKERIKQRADLKDFHATFITEARASGLLIYISTSLSKAESEAIKSSITNTQVQSRSCAICNTSFLTVQKLKLHQYRVHGIKHPLRRHITGNSCPCCLRYFHTRNTVLHHLRYPTRHCYKRLFEQQPFLSKEESDQLDEQENERQKQARKAGQPEASARLPFFTLQGPHEAWAVVTAMDTQQQQELEYSKHQFLETARDRLARQGQKHEILCQHFETILAAANYDTTEDEVFSLHFSTRLILNLMLHKI